MSCNVFLYEVSFKPLRVPSIELIAATDSATVLDTKRNQRRSSSRWGAKLVFSPSSFIYSVYAFDHQFGSRFKYAPVFFKNLNGNYDGQLDFVMHRMPQPHSGIGPAPSNYSEIESYIQSQPRWSDDEKAGVRALARAVMESEDSNFPIMGKTVSSWGEQLSSFGISDEIFSSATITVEELSASEGVAAVEEEEGVAVEEEGVIAGVESAVEEWGVALEGWAVVEEEGAAVEEEGASAEEAGASAEEAEEAEY